MNSLSFVFLFRHQPQNTVTNDFVKATQPPAPPPLPISSMAVVPNNTENHKEMNDIQHHNKNMSSLLPPQQKVAPRNNEYLEKQQQNRNLDRRGPSPAQANDGMTMPTQIRPPPPGVVVAVPPTSNTLNNTLKTPTTKDILFHHIAAERPPLSNHVVKMIMFTEKPVPKPHPIIPKTVPLTEVDEIKFKPVKIRLIRIGEDDQKLMQDSVSQFLSDRGEIAKKLGLIKEEVSLFSKMKLDEKYRNSLLGKRRADTSADVPLSAPKLRKVDRKMIAAPTKLSKDEIIKSNMYVRFMSTMDQILEQLDDPEAPLLLTEENYDNVDLIATNTLQTISAEAAKLKAKGNAIELLPQNKLTLLINYAMRSIHVAKNISAGPDLAEDLVSEECLEKIVNAIEAALLISNIYSCRSTALLQEDHVDIIIKFIQFQLRETIFPSYDPVYTVETKKKTSVSSKKNQKHHHHHQKEMSRLYAKIVELTKIVVTLLDRFQFEDTIIIHASALGIEPFFVDNIDSLQFVCLDLVTTIFQNDKYVKHRTNILSEILASVDRLPHTKRHLRPYKLTNSAGNIQMITALVLQLIQCSVILPDALIPVDEKSQPSSRSGKKSHSNHNNSTADQQQAQNISSKTDGDILIREKYDTAVSIGGHFLSTFLNKCRTRSGESDFRNIFENFIDDLLTTVNKPEWPAAELLLSLLGTLLVNSMSNKGVEQSLRVVSLEYLGVVAARLRKDTVVSRCKVDTMDQLIKLIKIEQEKEGDKDDDNSKVEIDAEEERTEFLQRILLDFLAVNAQDENIVWCHSRHFYLTQWYRDVMQRKKKIGEGEKGYASRKKVSKKRKKFKGGQSDSSGNDDESDEDDNDDGGVDGKSLAANKKNSTIGGVDHELNLEIFRILDKRKRYLLTKISPYSDTTKVHEIKTYIDYSNAQLIAQYLASKRSFSQSFDKYLQKIILVVR